MDGKQVAAHIVSWILHNGEVPTGLCVLHKCDVRRCVNPEHLYLGTKKQNRKDFMDRHPKAKELVLSSQKTAAKGAKKFWESMNEKERKEFISKRAASQAKKFKERKMNEARNCI